MDNEHKRSTRRSARHATGRGAKKPTDRLNDVQQTAHLAPQSDQSSPPLLPQQEHSALPPSPPSPPPAPQSDHSAFRIPHSALPPSPPSPPPASQSDHSAFRIPHSALPPSPPSPPPAPQSDHSAFRIPHSALTDLHHHIVWGVDHDGPKTMDDSIAMVRAALADGITHIITTPHVMPGIRPFDEGRYRENLAALREWVAGQGLPLALYPGAEIFYTPMAVQHLNEGRVPTMNGGAHVLVEFDPAEPLEDIRKACAELTAHGYIPILAHTERYKALVHAPHKALRLREEYGLATQVNCNTIIRPKGFFQTRFIKALMKEGALDYIATDAHNVTTRPVRMREAIRALAKYGVDAGGIMQRSNELMQLNSP